MSSDDVTLPPQPAATITAALSTASARAVNHVVTVCPPGLYLLSSPSQKVARGGYPRVNRGLTVGAPLPSYTRRRDLGSVASESAVQCRCATSKAVRGPDRGGARHGAVARSRPANRRRQRGCSCFLQRRSGSLAVQHRRGYPRRKSRGRATGGHTRGRNLSGPSAAISSYQVGAGPANG